MAETIVTKSADASVDTTTAMLAPQISGLECGEDIPAPMTPLRLDSTTGQVFRASAAVANANARVVGFSARKGKTGQPMTVYGLGLVGKYSDGNLTPGMILFLGETVGTLSSIATTADAVGIAQAVDPYNIRITRAI